METKKYRIYYSFLNKLAAELTSFYFKKINKKFSVKNKHKGKGYDPVTTSDKAFEKFIRSKISKRFPDHQIIGEEYGHKNTKSEFSWVIDPIDGTKAFVAGLPVFGSMIGLMKNNTPYIGLIDQPITGERIWGGINGSFLNKKP